MKKILAVLLVTALAISVMLYASGNYFDDVSPSESATEEQCNEMISGFASDDIIVDDFRLGGNGLELTLANTGTEFAEIQGVDLNGESAEISEDEVSLGETTTATAENIVDSDECNEIDIVINYSSEGLPGTSTGTLTGKFR